MAGHGDDSVYLDLCNDRWAAAQITTSGWRVVQSEEIRTVTLRAMPFT